MKYQKLFVFFFAFIFTFILYSTFKNNKIYYLSLGDNFAVGLTPFDEINKSYSDYFCDYLENKNLLDKYNNYFSEINYKTTDLINDIKLNKEKEINDKKISINESIAKSDIITISIGFNDLFYSAKYNKEECKINNKMKENIDKIFKNIEEIISLIRKINDSDIYFIGYFNPHNEKDGITDSMIDYLENKFKTIDNKNIYYIDIKEGFKNKSYYLPNIKNPNPSLEGYNFIANSIIKEFEQNNKK